MSGGVVSAGVSFSAAAGSALGGALATRPWNGCFDPYGTRVLAATATGER